MPANQLQLAAVSGQLTPRAAQAGPWMKNHRVNKFIQVGGAQLYKEAYHAARDRACGIIESARRHDKVVDRMVKSAEANGFGDSAVEIEELARGHGQSDAHEPVNLRYDHTALRQAQAGPWVQRQEDLPDLCYTRLLSGGPGHRIGLIKKGESGYYPSDYDTPAMTEAQVEDLINELNRRLGVSESQRMAMETGSMFGWENKGANPNHIRKTLRRRGQSGPWVQPQYDDKQPADAGVVGEKLTGWDADDIAAHQAQWLVSEGGLDSYASMLAEKDDDLRQAWEDSGEDNGVFPDLVRERGLWAKLEEVARQDADEDQDIYTIARDDLVEYLSGLMAERNPSGRWRCQVNNFGWQSRGGKKDFDATDGKELLAKILPRCDCTFKVFDYTQRRQRGFMIQNWHHDSPTGAEKYYLLPRRGDLNG